VGLQRGARGGVSEVVEKPAQLTKLPLLTTWELDGGPFITLPLVYTEHPEKPLHNLGMYRVQRYDDQTTGLHMQLGKGGGFHLAEAARLGRKLPVNIAIGGPPALILAAIAPLPENVPELLLASLMLGKRLPLANNPLGPLPVLQNAEFVLVGEVDPNERRPEGPFGDHYGYYSLQHDYPVFHCHGVLRRKNPLCAATVVGKPRQEDFFLGDYLQELLSPLFPLVMPAVQDLWSYGETGYHSLAAAVVKQRYKREAMASAFRILGEGQLSLTKFLLVLDQPRDLKDFRGTLEHILARCDFRTDLYVFSNLAMDTLDYTGPTVNEGSKGVLLGVGAPIRDLRSTYEGPLPRGSSAVKAFCAGCLTVQGPSYQEAPQFGSQLAEDHALNHWPLVVLVDDVVKTNATEMSFLWTAFTRFEPGADIFARQKNIVRNHLAYEPPIVIDARMKPSYPDELFCDPETAALVDRRWLEYFPAN
jgi:UbiD family decarboxylase